MSLTVLVPLDGSSLAAQALPFAASLVSSAGGRLVLTHVQSPATTLAPPDYDPAREVELLRHAGLTASSLVYCTPTEDVADVLDLAIREVGADLVVMSTHGRSGLRRSVFGSVADRLIRRVEVPVALVPPRCAASWEARRPAQILVPLDGSPLAEQALDTAAHLAHELAAEILLVRSVSPIVHARYRGTRLTLSCADFAEIEDAWRYLSNVADDLRPNGLGVTIRVLIGSSAAAIADAARTERMDLIVMTTHGRGGLSRFVLGSVADGVLQRTGVPVLLSRSGVAHRSARVASASTATAERAEIDGQAHAMTR